MNLVEKLDLGKKDGMGPNLKLKFTKTRNLACN